MPTRPLSAAAFAEAVQYIPGGVNSPVRALRAVGEMPLFIDHAEGATLTDIDGNRYTDFCLSWGVFLCGHTHPAVTQAAICAVQRGTSYGIPTQIETRLAQRVCRMVPSIERVRFVNSGTEAVMSAIRLARGFTGRDLIVKFEGCYHGHADHLLVSAGSGVATFGRASSAGVPESFVHHTACLPFNDSVALEQLFAQRGGEIAAVIVEPVPANMGVVPPIEGFLSQLRSLTARHGALLIFDEVITGFRLAPGGAQERFGVCPDLTTVGKIVGGGFPAAAFGGRADIMSLLAPDGPVYQAGTLSGNPVAMAAGIATLDLLAQPGLYAALWDKADRFTEALAAVLRPKGILLQAVGPMFTPFFPTAPTRGIRALADVQRCDTERFARFFRHMLRHGIYLSPSQFETNFVCLAHTSEQLQRTLQAAEQF